MKNGKKKVKKTITVKVSSAKKVVVTAHPAKTTNKPTNGSTNGPTKEPVKEPTATPTATSTTKPVSYTQLDVYKRQCKTREKAIIV